MNSDGGFDIERIRRDFPILKREVNGHPLVYLDNAATSHRPVQVMAEITRFYRDTNSNIHRGVHTLSVEATERFEAVRERVRAFLGAPDASEIIFTRNTTESINLVAHAWGRTFLEAGDEVLISEIEHHSNIVPWQMLRDARGIVLRHIPDAPRRHAGPRRGAAADRPAHAAALDHADVERPRDDRARWPSWRSWRGRRARACWWTPPRPRRTCRSMSASWARTSSPAPRTRCSAPPASACSGAAASCWRRCRPSSAAAT